MLDESCTSFHPHFRSIRHHGRLYLLLLKCWALIRALICRVSCFRHVGDWNHSLCLNAVRFPSHSLLVFANNQVPRCPTKLRAYQVRFQVHRILNINFISKFFSSTFQLLTLFRLNWAVVYFLPIWEVSPLPYPVEVQCQVASEETPASPRRHCIFRFGGT